MVVVYSLVVFGTLACIYAHIADWRAANVNTVFWLLLLPIMILTVPTLSLFADASAARFGVRRSLGTMIVRSLIEMLIICPVWFFLCVLFALASGLIVILDM